MSHNTLTKHTPEEIAEILRHIPPAPDNETWVKICASVCSEIGETDGLRILLDWSPDFGNKRTETVIRSFRGEYKSTVATLISIASEHGFNNSAFQKKRFEKYARHEAGSTHILRPGKAKPEQYRGKQSRRDSTHKKAQTQAAGIASAPPVELGECSICKSARKPETVMPCKLIDALAGIKSGKWKNEVEAVRAGTREKSTLPQICAYGVYNTRRRDENLTSRSGFLVLDYDGKENPGFNFSTLKWRLSFLPFVLAAFVSPSGNGLKVLIRIPNGASDSGALEAATKILAPLGGSIDKNSEARKHFLVSYDSDAFINSARLETIPELPNDLEEMSPGSLSAIFAETVGRFAFKGKDNYFYDAGTFYKELSKGDAIEEFTIKHGLSRKTAAKLLYAVREKRTVQDVFPALTCRKKGIHTLAERKVLVLRSPIVLEAEEGNFPLIKKALETIFPEGEYIQLRRFLAWLQHARKSFLKALASDGVQVSPAPLLMLLGTAGAGKDLLFQTLIRPALGNRQHAGADTFPQEKQWLGGIVGAECVLASEMPKLSGKERDKFKATIKQIIGGSGYNAESKGKDGFTFRGQHFITLLANIDEGGNCASACPAIDEDFKDKFVALNLGNTKEVKSLFPGEKANENQLQIRRELPAFLYWLSVYFDYPHEWKDNRFGITGYCSPEASRALFEVSQAATLREQLLFIAEKYPLEIFDKDFSTAEISARLQPHFKTLSLSALGKALRDLCKREPERFVFNGSQKHPAYRIPKCPIKRENETKSDEKHLKNRSPFEGLSF